jgi:hypothetical protein
MATEEDWVAEESSHEESESAFAWECRVLAVAFFCAQPGLLFGGLLRLVIPDGGPVTWWMGGGAALGAIFGALVEADYFTG